MFHRFVFLFVIAGTSERTQRNVPWKNKTVIQEHDGQHAICRADGPANSFEQEIEKSLTCAANLFGERWPIQGPRKNAADPIQGNLK